MMTNPALGVLLHAMGGFAAGSSYAPLRKIERWVWESFWLVMGLAAWLGAPWIVAWLTTPAGQAVLIGIAICLTGIALCRKAGMSKEAELTDEQKKASVKESALGKGFAVAAMVGILCACFAFGLAAGREIADISRRIGPRPIFSNNAVLVFILIGGFSSNAVWCIILNIKNRTFGDYVSGTASWQLLNYFLAALGGVIWYGPFFFYGMGTTKPGEKYDFSSWSIHMAFIGVFSNLWGIAFHEWRSRIAKTRTLVWGGILTLIISAMVIGYGNYLAD